MQIVVDRAPLQQTAKGTLHADADTTGHLQHAKIESTCWGCDEHRHVGPRRKGSCARERDRRMGCVSALVVDCTPHKAHVRATSSELPNPSSPWASALKDHLHNLGPAVKAFYKWQGGSRYQLANMGQLMLVAFV